MKACRTLLKRLKQLAPLCRNHLPGQLIIQYTDMCNASCPQCGMRTTESFKRSTLDLDTAKKIIDRAASNGVTALSLTGGEPLLYIDKVAELIRYAGDAGISYTRTGTNGFLFMNHNRPDYQKRVSKIAETLARSGLYTFWISIDSCIPAIHERMRGLPGVIPGIEKALPIMHDHGIYPSANLGINRNIVHDSAGNGSPSIAHPSEFYESFREAFGRFYAFVIDMGFTIANACYPMSIGTDKDNGLSAAYGATSDAHLVQFTNDEKPLLFKALFDTIPLFRSKIRIFSPRSSLYSLIRQYTVGEEYCYPCRGGTDFFFVDAKEGAAYPCGYRGDERLGKYWEIDIKELDPSASCTRCDWECFRDPSELMGPVASLFSEPLTAIEKFIKDKSFARLWLNDISYFRACNFFDASKPPDYNKMAAFLPKPSGAGR
jgi:MoaA/NifB/PqqE/SkfB family radical SAM enzyme